MEKRDLKKESKHLYQPSAKKVVQVEVPTMKYLMVDGTGDPHTSPAYAEAVEALFAVSYTIKFMVEKGPAGIDYGVMPLEGLRWANDMSTFTTKNKSNWKWTMMIMQPDFVTCALIDRAVEDVKRKKALTALGNVRCAPLTEGTCVQIMPVGPFSAEGPTIQRLHLFIADCGCAPVGKHHEIHLSDIRKTDPGKWKAIIRQPMQ